jgi:hypothetical protein
MVKQTFKKFKRSRQANTPFFFKILRGNFFFIYMNRKSLVAIKSVRWSPQVLVVFIWNHPALLIGSISTFL